MEMPEGWNKLQADEGRVDYALLLLKEMAEALDYVARGPRPDDSDSAVAKQALNKFKEWK